MANRLRVGIAGYGVVGHRRREVIDQNPILETVAVSDKLLHEGTMDDGVRCYPDPYSLMAENLDILFVSLPNDLAPKVTIEGLSGAVTYFARNPQVVTSKTLSASFVSRENIRTKN